MGAGLKDELMEHQLYNNRLEDETWTSFALEHFSRLFVVNPLLIPYQSLVSLVTFRVLKYSFKWEVAKRLSPVPSLSLLGVFQMGCL